MDSFEEQFTETFETATLSGTITSLVGLREQVADGLYERILASRDFLGAHLPWVDGTSEADVKKRVRSWILSERLGQGGCWQILDGEKKLAGFIMMETNLRNRSATLSYWLFKEFAGRGLMTDALKTLCDYCFSELRLNRLELFASVDNAKSRAVAERCGFRSEGICRDYELKNGVFVDHCRYSRLACDVYRMFT